MLRADATTPTGRRRRPAGPAAHADPDLQRSAELFSVAQLQRHARAMAGWHQVVYRPRRGGKELIGPAGADRLLKRLGDNATSFAAAYQLISEAVGRGRQITPAAEWFIDNYHLIDDQIATARRHLPRSYSRELPRLVNAAVPGTPRVYELALELVSHSHGRVDADGLVAFVAAYQEVQPLGLGELWAIPVMLRLALLENLRRVAASVTSGRHQRERALFWASEMIAVTADDPGRLVLVIADLVELDASLPLAFVAELAARMQAQGNTLHFALAWLEQRLAERGQSIDHVFNLASQSQAADQVSVSNSIAGLRFLGATDWRVFVESVSVVEHVLRGDRHYRAMDFGTRDRYRHAIESIARGSAGSEADVARWAMALATTEGRHVGWFLIGGGRGALELQAGMRVSPRMRIERAIQAHRLGLYASSIVGLTALVVSGVALWGPSPAVPVPWFLLVALCASQIAIAVVHTAATLIVGPKLLPRLDFTRGIADGHRTAVAVPAMLTDALEIDELVLALEVRFLANRDANLCYVLLTDLRDAASEHLDTDAALIARAEAAITALNAKYEGRPDASFLLMHRPRRWNPSEGVWMGWERKRGKLEDFNAALRGDSAAFSSIVGPVEALDDIRYVIALDADTALPRDAAKLLAGTLGHPLNRPVYDPAKARITAGYAILQPRVGVSMAGASRSRFARLFAGEPGIDPYTRAVSDVYQDLFDESSFIGKGIYDVDAVRAALAGRLPENRVLSHDLLESGYARCGLVSDVVLVEDFPSAHAAEVSRRTRWIRGDWQIASWLGPRVPSPSGRAKNPLGLITRWKVFDNLRRSVVPLALIALLAIGWTLAPVFATLAVITVLVLPGLLSAATALGRRPEEQPASAHLTVILQGLGRQLRREAFVLATLPYDALVALGAITTTLVRMIVTRRHLLSWRTAADAQRSRRKGLLGSYATLWIGPALAVVGFVFAPMEAWPIFILWLLGPGWAWWLSRPLEARATKLAPDDIVFLRGVARRTWRFFETFVGPDDNHLPPDNFQEEGAVGAAHRTSPTNIGVSLIGSLAAFDLGYLSGGELVARTTKTLASLDRLRRHRGHFLNWYDTKTLEPLMPMYVSTVDSGNLAGHLLTLASGLDELAAQPIVGPQALRGLADTVTILEGLTTSTDAHALIAAFRADLTAPTLPALTRLHVHATALAHLVEGAEARWWATTLASTCADFMSELQTLGEHPTLAAADSDRLTVIASLAQRCRELADFEVDFLYDRTTHLLAVGYNVSDQRVDTSNYDLLASEARLCSFIAIAQGKLPQEHWFSLGRQLTVTRGHPTLLSWSGSMFEYLMPLLVMPSYPHTLLDETYHAVVARQIAHGRREGLPWGVSESGYNKTDGVSYQYRAFGVPGLGFKRGLGDDRVVAPYATLLALMVAPEAAHANLRRLAEDGQLGAYGFYEAIDYTPARLPAGKSQVTVRSYMAHHQGMGLLSLVHLLCGRPMQRRFDADLGLRATDLLLQERVPVATTIYRQPLEPTPLPTTSSDDAAYALRVFAQPGQGPPEVHLLSNGRYHVAITDAGGGYSHWRDLAITRWHEDATRDAWGSFGYLRDVTTEASAQTFWSLAHQPTLRPATRYEAIFSQGRAEFRRLDAELETHVEISVSPEDDVELRRVSLTNRARTTRVIEVTSYAEVVLATAAADAAHPAFSNLFVQTEIVHDQQTIVVSRRPRSAAERPPWLVHHLTTLGTTDGATSYETARVRFIGRGRSPADPLAMYQDALGDSDGAVLDPIIAIRQRLVISPGETACVHLVTGVSDTRAAALGLVEKYRDRHAAERLLELSWTQSQVVQRRLEASNRDIQLYEGLASNILFANPALRAPKSLIARSRNGQSSLWAHAISGDLPIVLVRIADVAGLDLVRHLVKAHAYWRLKGLAAELLVWIEDTVGYRQVLMDAIVASVRAASDAAWLDAPGGIFIRRGEQISEQDKVLMQAVARAILSDSDGTFAEQVERRPRQPDEASALPPHARAPSVDRAGTRPDLVAFNGLGGFTQDGKEYVITTTRDRRTGAPWVNVLANPWFGSVVSESGSAYTWCENAHSYRLTPWSNDAVSDPSGEALYLRDEDDGAFWSPTLSPAGAATPHVARHGFGYSVFEAGGERGGHGIASKLTVYVAIDAPVKFLVLELTNHSGRARRLSVTALFELVLGDRRAKTLPHVVTEVDIKTAALIAKNPYSSDFAERVAFLDSSEGERTVSGDRLEMLGRHGSSARPACMRRASLSGRVGAALDPCMAMQVYVDLVEGQRKEVVFTFGSGRDLADARVLVARFRGTGKAHAALEQVWDHWGKTLGAVRVSTPDAALDVMANGWLMYQVIAARLWARSGFYQSGGAFGFRDQLQDAMALVHAAPELLRQQLLRAARRQFRDGDVQHWWHPPQGRGVRTHISDDYLWLPYATCRYITAIGDTGVLDERSAFLDGRQVVPGEDSYYDLPALSDEDGTLYEHCVRAIRHGLRFGAHGLPLMGSGDWNDGMNLVGGRGQGESVWLGFFLYDVLMRFAGVADGRGDEAFARTCRSEARTLQLNLEAHGWDGGWYRRAYFDDGQPLGSAQSAECRIDSLPQSWAVLSGAGDPERAELAMTAVDQQLVSDELGVIQLFTPAFDTSDAEPGYVKGYVPGIRENGGQYTHAAVWVVMAMVEAGEVERAWELFAHINPVHHGDSAAAIATYAVEPYVVAADVYTNPQHAGRGGWTWYTGAAGWMYRLVVESLLGLHLEVDRLRITPRIPAAWPGFEVDYRFRDTPYHIRVARGAVRRVTCDGVEQPDGALLLVDDQRLHAVEVTLP